MHHYKTLLSGATLIAAFVCSTLLYANEIIFPPASIHCDESADCYYDFDHFVPVLPRPGRGGTFIFEKATSTPDPEVPGMRITYFYRNTEEPDFPFWLWANPKHSFWIAPYGWKDSCYGNASQCGFVYSN